MQNHNMLRIHRQLLLALFLSFPVVAQSASFDLFMIVEMQGLSSNLAGVSPAWELINTGDSDLVIGDDGYTPFGEWDWGTQTIDTDNYHVFLDYLPNTFNTTRTLAPGESIGWINQAGNLWEPPFPEPVTIELDSYTNSLFGLEATWNDGTGTGYYTFGLRDGDSIVASTTLPFTLGVGDGLPDRYFTNVPGAVPIPAAAWLFGSALIGLGIVKRKNA